MTVFINAASANMGGAVTYLRNLLEHLPRAAPESRFIVCVPDHTRRYLAPLVTSAQIHFQVYPHARTGGVQRFLFDQLTVPQQVRETRSDVLFSSTGFGTWRARCPQVLLVRNTVYFDKTFMRTHQGQNRSLGRTLLRRWLSLTSIARAQLVLFPTRAMGDMVAAHAWFALPQTQVLHYGLDASFQRLLCSEEEPSNETHSLAQRMQAWREDGYIVLLNVSTYAVHKNFEVLIEALPLLRAHRPQLKLVTTTSEAQTGAKEAYRALKERGEQLGLEGMWEEGGYVDHADLPGLYRQADVFVFPSFTESFGHPLVEALAFGLPVAAADTAVNREICEQAGYYFDAFSPPDLARTVLEALERGQAASSRTRAAHFSWTRYARVLMNMFHGLADSQPTP
ncbi:MAG: glycosyltransferase family 1 protein [Bacteroidota bacterium]